MQIITLASGSTGNCTLVIDRDTAILIDIGISTRRVREALNTFGLTPDDLSGVLITHEHTDHIYGLTTFVKNYEVPIFAPRTVANHLCWSITGVADLLEELSIGSEETIGALNVVPFRTPHDTPESVGYRVSGSSLLGYCTDCGCVTAEMLEALRGADCALIEANHDTRMLLDGRYPAYLKRRILSDHGHLSNEACGDLALALAKAGTRDIILAHLSRENNTPAQALSTVTAALHGMERETRLHVAPERDYYILNTEDVKKC